MFQIRRIGVIELAACKRRQRMKKTDWRQDDTAAEECPKKNDHKLIALCPASEIIRTGRRGALNSHK